MADAATLGLIGVIVGLVLGLTGAGGSILAVPLLIAGMGWSVVEAAPVALIAVFASATVGTWSAWRRGIVRYRAALLMGVLGTLLAPAGLAAARVVPLQALTLLFAMVLIVVALRLWLQAVRAPADAGVMRAALPSEAAPSADPVCKLSPHSGRLVWTRPCMAVIAACGAVTGVLSGLFGVGGGFVIVPALRAVTDLSMAAAVATSLMAIALISGGTLTVAVGQGFAPPLQQALPFAAAAVAGMVLGRWLAPRIGGARLQQGFSILMFAAAIGVAIDALAPGVS
jgi:uncharacterized membrane protein YfcA